VAKEAFDRLMPTPNQIGSKKREDVVVTAADLLQFEPEAPITEKGLRLNINVAIQYVGAWLVGQGAVPIYNLMEDAATAEISRTQIWQWIRHGATLDDGRTVTRPFVRQLIAEESAARLPAARSLFEAVATSEELTDFLTLPAYEILVNEFGERLGVPMPATRTATMTDTKARG
jgi:malate synthase